ncbi:MAG: DMT family transporter [Thermomicrobiales bacterium]
MSKSISPPNAETRSKFHLDTNRIPPVAFILAAAVMWSTIGTSYRLILRHFDQVDSISLVTIRAIAATLMLVAWLSWRNPQALRPPKASLPGFALFGLLAITGFYAVYAYALEWSSVPISTVLLYLAPSIVGIGAAIFLGEQFGLRQGVSTLLAFAGCVLVVGLIGGDNEATTKGIVAGLASAALYASFTLLGKPLMARYGSSSALVYHLIFGSIGLVVVSLIINGGIKASLGAILVIGLFNGIFNTLLPIASYSIGMQRMNAGTASTIATVEPVLAIVLSWALLDESLGIVQILGAGLVVAAVLLLTWKRRAVEPIAP